MADKRQRNMNWNVADDNGRVNSWDQVQVAVLMDIREELQRLNRLLHCENFQNIPAILRLIRSNTAKPRKRKARKS